MAPGSNKTVYPSGSDLATYSEPMLLPAPALFSMNTCWPHIAESLSASMRDNIRRTSRGDRHNDAHGFGWVAGLRRLRARRERPRSRRAAEKRDEIAPPHGAYPQGQDQGLTIAGPGLDW